MWCRVCILIIYTLYSPHILHLLPILYIAYFFLLVSRLLFLKTFFGSPASFLLRWSVYIDNPAFYPTKTTAGLDSESARLTFAEAYFVHIAFHVFTYLCHSCILTHSFMILNHVFHDHVFTRRMHEKQLNLLHE